MKRLIATIGLFAFALAGIVRAAPFREPPNREELPGNSLDWKKTLVEIPKQGMGYTWTETLRWFSRQAILPLDGTVHIPKTEFRLVQPPLGKKLALTDIYEILNENLQTKGVHIMRGPRSLILVPLEGIDTHPVQCVDLDDLKNRLRTEIVEIVLKLPEGQDAKELAFDVKRLCGPFGAVTPIEGNRLIIRSDVGTLEKIK